MKLSHEVTIIKSVFIDLNICLEINLIQLHVVRPKYPPHMFSVRFFLPKYSNRTIFIALQLDGFDLEILGSRAAGRKSIYELKFTVSEAFGDRDPYHFEAGPPQMPR